MSEFDDARSATERFFERLQWPCDEGRRVRPRPITVTLKDAGELTISFEPEVEVRQPCDNLGPRIELSLADWFELLEGPATATELWFAGRLKLVAAETWRGEYARLFNAIRTTHGRPVL